MILKALVDYYERRCSSNDAARRLPPYGWIRRPVDYVFVVDDKGLCHGIELLGTQDKGIRRGRPLVVPAIGKQALKHTNTGTDANLLWDGARFIIGAEEADHRRQLAFVQTIDDWLPDVADPAVIAVKKFVRAAIADREFIDVLLARHGFSDDFSARDPVVVFRLRSDEILAHERQAIRAAYEQSLARSDLAALHGCCMLTGAAAVPLATNETVIKGVRDSQTSGANIVSYNADAFLSYVGDSRNDTVVPIGRRASFAYSTALNALLESDSPNKVQIGDATTIIWADRDATLDAELAAVFGDNPDAHVQAVRDRLNAVAGGQIGADDSGLRFFVLGLAPNDARVAVRYWLHEAFQCLGPRILRHFDDLCIVQQSDKDSPTPSMKSLLRSLAVRGEDKNIPPRLAGEWLRSILEGTPYPVVLLNATINRCRAEQTNREFGGNVTYLRAAILKACINRTHRQRHRLPDDHQFIKEKLDMSQDHPAYRLGRLFAVLEEVQKESAAPETVKATIRHRYYGAASSTPCAVFPTLLSLATAHFKKLADKPAAHAHYHRLIGEICGSVEQPQLIEFPRQLDLYAQGLFALGYYHQRESRYPRKGAAAPAPDTAVQEI